MITFVNDVSVVAPRYLEEDCFPRFIFRTFCFCHNLWQNYKRLAIKGIEFVNVSEVSRGETFYIGEDTLQVTAQFFKEGTTPFVFR